MKGILYFGLGSATGFIVEKVILEKKYQKEYEEVRKEFREEKEKLLGKDISVLERESERDIPVKNTSNSHCDKDSLGDLKKARENASDISRNYVSCYKETENEVDDEAIDIDDAEDGGVGEPYQINAEDFGITDGFEQVTWVWYQDDVILDSQDDHVIKNRREYIGSDLTKDDVNVDLRELFLETDAVYFRCPMYHLEIEIISSLKTSREQLHPEYSIP